MITTVPAHYRGRYRYAVSFNCVYEMEKWNWAMKLCGKDTDRLTNTFSGPDAQSNRFLILFRDEQDYIWFLLRWS